MSHEEHIYRQAKALCARLQNDAYHVLCMYARLPYSEPRAYTDPRVVRLKRLIAKAEARRDRRFSAVVELCRRFV